MPRTSQLTEPESLLLTWQDPVGRQRFIVGEVVKPEQGQVWFRYPPGEELDNAVQAGFVGYPAFPDLSKTYTSGVLDSFITRLPPSSRHDYNKFLKYWRIDPETTTTPFALLGYTGASLPRDGFRFVPTFSERDSIDLVIELAGYRHYSTEVQEGDRVCFISEPDNPHDPEAIMAFVEKDGNREPIGYVMRGLHWQFGKWLNRGVVEGEIIMINGTPSRQLALVLVHAGVPAEHT